MIDQNKPISIDDIPFLIGMLKGTLASCADRGAIERDVYRGMADRADRIIEAINDGLLKTRILVTLEGGVLIAVGADNTALVGDVILREFDDIDDEDKAELAEAGDLFRTNETDYSPTLYREVLWGDPSPIATYKTQPFANPVAPSEVA